MVVIFDLPPKQCLFPVVTGGHRWSQVVTGGHRWSQVVTGGHRWSQVVAGGRRWGHSAQRPVVSDCPPVAFNHPALPRSARLDNANAIREQW